MPVTFKFFNMQNLIYLCKYSIIILSFVVTTKQIRVTCCFLIQQLQGGKMNTNIKVVQEALLDRNFFEFDSSEGQESLNNLNNATDLQSIIIRIEKNFTVSQYDFQYSSEKDKFIRLHETECAEHYIIHKKCSECAIQCFRSEYSVDEFIELCRNVFEPISVKLA